MDMRAEEFIRDYTKTCSNELVGGGYHEWLTPEQALRAIEIAREDVINWTEKDEEVFQYLKGGFEYNGNRLKDEDTIMTGVTVGMYRSFIRKIESLKPKD